MFSNTRFLYLAVLLFISSIGLSVSVKLPKRLKDIKKKLERISKGEKKENIFLDINELEYPGADETLRKLHEERWEDYYKCLRKRQLASGIHKTLYPIAVTAVEGTSILLNCEICISPGELHTIELIDWYYNSTTNNKSTNAPVDNNEYIVVSPSDRSLHMYNVDIDKEGFYWCQLQDTFSNPYYLYVVNGSEEMRVVQGEEEPTPPTILEDYGLRLFTLWSTWSSCSSCNAVGRKQRYGFCTIELLNSKAGEEALRRRRNEEMEDSEASETNLTALIRKILIFFGNKLPCRSRYTPKQIQQLPEIENRTNEVQKRFCKVKCQDNVIFEIRDKSGNVIESANNSAGVYSMIQGLPDPVPPVQRITVYKKHNSKGELKCPGNLNEDTPVTWQIGTKLVNPLSIKTESNSRIWIDSRDHLIFKNLHFADSNVYSCWQRGKLAGTIRLEVTYELEVKADHRVLMLGAITIVLVFLVVFWRAFKGRKRYTMH